MGLYRDHLLGLGVVWGMQGEDFQRERASGVPTGAGALPT